MIKILFNLKNKQTIFMVPEIKDFSHTFFDKLGLDIEKIEVTKQEENIFFLKIDTPDSGIMIWTHWVTFQSLQTLLRKLFKSKFWEETKLRLEINDYTQNKDQKLFSFIDREINKAKETGRNMKLPVLNSYERKKVHGYISDLKDPEIFTQSRWEWRERRLFIILSRNSVERPRNTYKNDSKLEIDIDWEDI